jgi:hypothetical protein
MFKFKMMYVKYGENLTNECLSYRTFSSSYKT